jgi:acetoacetyl-CoA synthetase
MTALWMPSKNQLEHSQMAIFGQKYGHEGFDSLLTWSISNKNDFWLAWLSESGIIYSGKIDQVYQGPRQGCAPGGKWFEGLTLNYAQNLMRKLPPVALVGLDESGLRCEFSSKEVHQKVRALQLYLLDLGVRAGDRVAACVPHSIETVVCMLAVTSLGAVWSSCSPDFGEQAMVDRFAQIEPRLLIYTDTATYAGKTFSTREKIEALKIKLPRMSHSFSLKDFEKIVREFTDHAPVEFVKVPFSHPLFIMFSSGTTGVPKCIVHGTGGTLLQHSKELLLHCDLRQSEKILYFTTCGWMMWNWCVSALFAGATLYCFDGSPAHPNPDSLLKKVLSEKINVFGCSAKFLAAMRSQKIVLDPQMVAESALRMVLSTGSPLLPEDFDYFYAHFASNSHIQLCSISGGTDILSCFMLGNPLTPVNSGEIQGAGLGMDIRAFDSDGHDLIGEKGELVCANTFPSMPLGFWNDEGGKKYHSAYFEKFKNVWHHGDYITLNVSGGIVVHGRSDATLNPGGVRIGTAEIYRQVETLNFVADSLVVGHTLKGDERIVLFVKLKNGTLTQERIDEIKKQIKSKASPRHVPSFIFEIVEVPYTLSGKKVELAVKQILAGEKPQNTGALANPKSLEAFALFKESLSV